MLQRDSDLQHLRFQDPGYQTLWGACFFQGRQNMRVLLTFTPLHMCHHTWHRVNGSLVLPLCDSENGEGPSAKLSTNTVVVFLFPPIFQPTIFSTAQYNQSHLHQVPGGAKFVKAGSQMLFYGGWKKGVGTLKSEKCPVCKMKSLAALLPSSADGPNTWLAVLLALRWRRRARNVAQLTKSPSVSRVLGSVSSPETGCGDKDL